MMSRSPHATSSDEQRCDGQLTVAIDQGNDKIIHQSIEWFNHARCDAFVAQCRLDGTDPQGVLFRLGQKLYAESGRGTYYFTIDGESASVPSPVLDAE